MPGCICDSVCGRCGSIHAFSNVTRFVGLPPLLAVDLGTCLPSLAKRRAPRLEPVHAPLHISVPLGRDDLRAGYELASFVVDESSSWGQQLHCLRPNRPELVRRVRRRLRLVRDAAGGRRAGFRLPFAGLPSAASLCEGSPASMNARTRACHCGAVASTSTRQHVG